MPIWILLSPLQYSNAFKRNWNCSSFSSTCRTKWWWQNSKIFSCRMQGWQRKRRQKCSSSVCTIKAGTVLWILWVSIRSKLSKFWPYLSATQNFFPESWASILPTDNVWTSMNNMDSKWNDIQIIIETLESRTKRNVFRWLTTIEERNSL